MKEYTVFFSLVFFPSAFFSFYPSIQANIMGPGLMLFGSSFGLYFQLNLMLYKVFGADINESHMAVVQDSFRPP